MMRLGIAICLMFLASCQAQIRPGTEEEVERSVQRWQRSFDEGVETSYRAGYLFSQAIRPNPEVRDCYYEHDPYYVDPYDGY